MLSYNQEQFVKASIDSVFAQEGLSADEIELVLFDDCSDDSTYEIAKRMTTQYPGLRVYRNTVNIGITKNANKALRACTCNLVAFLSADDLFTPQRLISQINWFNENPDAVLCTSGVSVLYTSTGFRSRKFEDRDCLNNNPKKLITQFNQLPTSRYMINRANMPECSYDERLLTVSDWLFFNNIAMKGRIGGTSELGVFYRRHPHNTTKKGLDSAFLTDRLVQIDLFLALHPQCYFEMRIQRSHVFNSYSRRAMIAERYKSALYYAVLAFMEVPFNIRSLIGILAISVMAILPIKRGRFSYLQSSLLGQYKKLTGHPSVEG